MGYIITIANQKGGVGKTTTAVNLSASLAAAEKSCLLVDCDPQGNATTGLGIDRKSVKNGLYEYMMGSISYQEAIMDTELAKLKLIGATIDLVGAEIELATAEEREYKLKKCLHPLKEQYDYIFLDCPPSLGLMTVNALTAADSILVPLQCEYYAMEGLSQLIQTVKAVKKSLNPGLKMAGILLTMYDGRNNLAVQVAADVREHFNEAVFQSVIPRNVRLSEAPSHGKPIILYDIKSSGAQSYLALAQELVARGAGYYE